MAIKLTVNEANRIISAPLQLRRTLLILLTVSVLAACVSVESVHEPRLLANGQGVELFEQVRSGETTATWLLEHLGNPDAVIPGPLDSEILRYDNQVEHRAKVAVRPLLDVKVRRDVIDHYYFQCRDGVVDRYWVDRAKP